MNRRKRIINEMMQKTAINHGVSLNEVMRNMQEAIDNAWLNPDPVERANFLKMFPNGKPSIDEFIWSMTNKICQEDNVY